MILNALGLAAVVWRIEAGNRAGRSLRAVGISPANPADPDSTRELAVELNAPIDPETLAADTLRPVPFTPGRTVLRGPRTLVYLLDEKLKGATAYRLEFSPQLRGLGGQLPPPKPAAVETPRLELLRVAQVNRDASGDCTLVFEFNFPVSPAELLRNVTVISPQGTRPEIEKLGGAPERSVRLRCRNVPWSRLRVEVAAGLAGTEGPLGLAAACAANVDVSGRLRLLGMSPEFRGDVPTVRVRLNAPAEVGPAARLVNIDPPVKFSVEPSSEGLEILGPFECGGRYTVTLKAGLAAGAVRPLAADVSRTVWFPDKPAELRFAGEGGYLSPGGMLRLPVRTTNITKIRIGLQKLHAHNVVEYVARNERSVRRLAAGAPTLEVAVAGPRNREVETLLDLRELATHAFPRSGAEGAGRAPAGPDGIYCLELQGDPERGWYDETVMLVVTDLGVSARVWEGGALIWVTSIATGRPVEGARATLYSACRIPLGSGTTGAGGLATLGFAPPTGDDEPALVVVERGEALSYLNLERGERSRGPAAAGGRDFLSRGYEVAAASERGAYRPGDVVHLSSFVRGERLAAPPPMPLEVEVVRPGGRRLTRLTAISDTAGRLTLDVPVPAGAPTGRYRAHWRLPATERVLGSCDFLVADYMPRTLRMKLDAPAGRLGAREPFRAGVEVQHLFGDSASGLATACRARFTAVDFTPGGWEGFRFGDLRVRRGEAREHLVEQRLDAGGRTSFELRPPDVATPAAIRAEVEVEVRESGGRAMSERLVRDLDPWPFYVGAQPPEQPPIAGRPAVFEVAAVRPDGRLVEPAGRYSASLYRVIHNNVLQRVGRGRLEYVDMPHEELVATVTGDTAGGRARVQVTPDRAGEHRLVVGIPGGCSLACDLYVGGPGGGGVLADPESLRLTLDKPRYRPGETAHLAVRAPFGGTLLLAVETDRVLESRVAELPAGGEGTFDFAVSEAWRPNAYLTAAVVRAAEPEEEWRPHRASGVVRLPLDNADKRLRVEVESPAEARPDREVSLTVRVLGADGQARPGAAVVLAAVDEGVLALTGFRSPDPFGAFFAPRRLSVREHDMYSRLAPELLVWKAARPAAPGGDSGGARDDGDTGAEMSRRLSPVEAGRVRTAVLWAGSLTAGEDGAARVTLRVPEYIGELRVMASAAAGDCFGAESRPLPVRSPLMLRASWPRFAAPGDEFEVPVTVFNSTASAGPVALLVEGVAEAGSAAVLTFAEPPPAVVEVPAGGERTVKLHIRAGAVGRSAVRISASLGAERCADSLELPVRPPVPMAKRSGTALIEAGEETRITPDAEFYPGTAKCSLVVAASPVVELSGALGFLLQYPYGCVEQTTSRLVPLIYLRDLAALSSPGALGDGDVEGPLAAGIARLASMQTPGGGLSYWPGGSEASPWGSTYAADVLLEARKAGHDVPADLIDPLLAYLRKGLDSWAASDRPAEEEDPDETPTTGMVRPLVGAGPRAGGPGCHAPAVAAYACYVLARSGRPAHAWMASLEEQCRHDAKSVPAGARFHLAAAFLASGHATVAREFTADARPTCTLRETGGSLDSPVREAAVMLGVLLDADPGSTQVPALAERLRKATKAGRWGTTQDNAFALMALGKYARRLGQTSELGGTAVLPDGSEMRFGARQGLCLKELRPGDSVRIRADQGKGRLYAFWDAEGVPRDGRIREEDSGLSIRREMLAADGRPLPKGATLEQGRLYQVRLVVENPRWADNVVITDLLPAGLEIENPDLIGSAGRATAGQSTGVDTLSARHIERRDDRLLVFANLWSGRAEYRYAVRAVTAGKFVLPPTEAECMYDPGIFSINGGGKVEVVAR
ncbi:MAG TPA: MG2 domain-containing protein [Planctomycetota bacterium]|nr:MG2 domain-containing protein [Planctomycetota bacterium]